MAGKKDKAASAKERAERKAKLAKMSDQEKKVFLSAEKVTKFVTLATKRTNKALVALESIGALSNRGAYTYTDDQVERIFSALQTALDAARDKYSAKVSGGGFAL